MTPADAAARRAPAKARGQSLVDQGDPVSAGIEYDNAAAQLGDPVLYLDAGEAYYAGAEKNRDAEMARAAAERGRISLDILYFHLDSASDPDFKLVETSEIPALIVRAQELIDESEALATEIEAEAQAPEEDAEPEKKREIDRQKALTIAGAVTTSVGAGFLILGVAGIGLGIRHQLTAEDATVYGEEYDQVAAKGKRANTIAYVGLPIGGVLLGTGIALLVLAARDGGKKKPSEEDKLTLSPTWSPGGTGMAISGRF